MKYLVSPQSGWKYGFPKVWHKDKNTNLIQWLISEGYPNAEFDKWGALISETPNIIPCAWKCEIKELK